MRYQSKESIEAIQFTGSNEQELEEWLRQQDFRGKLTFENKINTYDGSSYLNIHLHGAEYLTVSFGDFLIFANGRACVVSQDWFKSHYYAAV